MTAANANAAVVLLNGAPIDMSRWMEGCGAIIEAWYPGEQGSQALCEILFGDVSPSAKLPITFPRSVGQLPLFYAAKPSGRGYGYVENDGSPLYPFGYGLSYTTFSFADFSCECEEKLAEIGFEIRNTGSCTGVEVVQIYLSGRNCDVVMPMKELKAYKRVELKAGEAAAVKIQVPAEAFFYYDRKMVYGMHDGDYTVMAGTSSEEILKTFEVKVRGGKIHVCG